MSSSGRKHKLSGHSSQAKKITKRETAPVRLVFSTDKHIDVTSQKDYMKSQAETKVEELFRDKIMSEKVEIRKSNDKVKSVDVVIRPGLFERIEQLEQTLIQHSEKFTCLTKHTIVPFIRNVVVTLLHCLIGKQPKKDRAGKLIKDSNLFDASNTKNYHHIIKDISNKLGWDIRQFRKNANQMTTIRNHDVHQRTIENITRDVNTAIEYLEVYSKDIRELQIDLSFETHVLKNFEHFESYVIQAWADEL